MVTPIVHTVIDVRELASCHERHAAIFNTFDNLASGEALEIIVDHDPRPLNGKFNEQRADQFTWRYVEAGPVLWRVQISRI